MEVKIERLQAGTLEEFRQLLQIFDEVFEYEEIARAKDSHLNKLLENDAFFVIVAKHKSKIVAGLSAYRLEQYHSDKPILYIQDLAVLESYQRKKIGSRLIDFTKAYSNTHGFQMTSVEAEKADDYAIDFYRSLKPSGEIEAVYFYYNSDTENEALNL